VLEKNHFQALDLVLRAKPTRWWGTHKENFDGRREYRRMMKVQFCHQKVEVTKKYDTRSDPCDHLAKWTNAYGAEP